MANRSTVAPSAADATVPTLAGPHEGLPGSAVPKVALGITQRTSGLGGATREGAPPQQTEAVKGKDEQPESLSVQQKQLGLLEQQKGLLERALEAWKAPPGPGLLPQVGQTMRDAGESMLIASGGYLAAKGVAQAQAAINKARASTRTPPGAEGLVDQAQGSAPAHTGAVVLPATIVSGADPALGADATPAPVPRPAEPRPAEPGRWAQALQAGKSASGLAGLDALMKLTFTATTASTPEQKGEGVGAALGGFTGAVGGAMLGSRFKVGAAATSMMAGFAGDKVGGAVGKGLMATPATPTQGASASDAGNGQPTSPSPATTLWGTLASAVGVGAGAAAFKHRGRLLDLARGKRGRVPDEPYPLGADAGPSPTGINPSAGRWATFKDAFKASGKLPWIEAGVKGAYTYATAKTPEEKGAGYGGAIGGAVGTALGGLLLGGFVSPPVGMLIGNMVGDKLGSVIGGWGGKTFFTDANGKSKPATTLSNPRHATPAAVGDVRDAQKDTRSAAQLSPGTPAALVASRSARWQDMQPGTPAQVHLPPDPAVLPEVAQSPGTPAALVASRSARWQDMQPGTPAQVHLPPGPTVLPEVAQPPSQPSAVTPPPAPQQLTFTANMPITVQGRVDSPNLLAEQLEETIKRVMLDLQRQAYNAQMTDPSHAL
ncbi:hypothetical protein [Pseudomonas sp. UFMG81]|uniref:hypothetical protein n=1 Tax=Pseudomonas sp. UFMG81 TaxID=2745936 RepID=UPI00188FA90D|nr:hypothetical protein [Pseudomonas sp. UFMG81]